MTKTLTEVEVKKATMTNHTARKAALAREEQFLRDSRLLWAIAPISLLVAGGTTFLAVRRWMNSNDSKRSRRLI